MSEELKPCHCGRPLDNLTIIDSGQGGKYANVCGDCCGEWMIEFRTQYNGLTTPECMSLAIKAWNEAPRAKQGTNKT